MEDEIFDLNTISKEYNDPEKARELLESLRWPDGPVCPHCKCSEHYKLVPKTESKKPVRKGVYKCKECRKQYTVTVGTIFEDSHIPLNKWIMAIFLLCSSKKGMSANQLHRMLGITYKSAWFMAHRIRYAMSTGPLSEMLKGTVEVDETYVGGKPRKGTGIVHKRGRGTKKIPVVVLVERGGRAKSTPMKRLTGKNLKKQVIANVHQTSAIMTDEFRSYNGIGDHFEGGHGVVNHGSGQYVDGNNNTNTAESYFALLKRGIMGSFHHVSEKHLHRYCAEFDFRWNQRTIKDGDSAKVVLGMIEGKRLKYRDSSKNKHEYGN